MGRGANPPPQFGQTFWRMFSTHERQKVHSKEQIIASVEFGGRGVLQFSQLGLSSSIVAAEINPKLTPVYSTKEPLQRGAVFHRKQDANVPSLRSLRFLVLTALD